MPVNQPSTRCFVDTNIWLYALITGKDTRKHSQAKEIVQHNTIIISTQIINETCVNLLKKAKLPDLTFHVGID